MNRQEYTEQMKDLCRKQAELKIAHMDNLEDLEAKTARLVADINENARVEKRQMKANYRREQLELECKKQQLRADYLMEHPEEAKNEN
jgi:hypothetical protein